MSWKLFLDDERNVLDYTMESCVRVARSSTEARALVEDLGMPEHCFFDHDLGGDDTTMVFLKWLANEYWDGEMPIPEISDTFVEPKWETKHHFFHGDLVESGK